MNPITLIDGYKLDHRRQYPPGTETVYSNFTARGSRVEGQHDVTFLGLQYALQKYLVEDMLGFFFSDEDYAAARYIRRVNAYLGPNTIGANHIRALHRLGYIPLEFHAIPEGTAVPLRVPMFTVENTHPDFAWVTNYFETLLSCELWMPCTSATTALRMRRLLARYAKQTGGASEFIPWQGHDFSFRGMPGVEAAALSGMGHLLAFTGTDTIPAMDLIEEYYGVPDNYMLAGSVAATEHSVMCAGGKANELGTYQRLLALYPAGVVSVVSDTWDLWNVLTSILPALYTDIMARDGKLVIRPDSGDPVKILCGDPDATPRSPAQLGVIRCLWNLFGGTTNAAGYKELDPHIGCIYGDSISYDRAEAILEGLTQHGFASSAMVFGMGSYTYQYVTRDTYNFAMKATWAQIAGHGVDLFKKPVTDDGMKNSAMGRLAVLPSPAGDLVLVNQATDIEQTRSLLRPVWRNGEWLVKETFDVIRERALR